MTCNTDLFGAPAQRARAKTISIKRMSKRALVEEQRRTDYLNAVDPVEPRPQTFGECERRGLGTVESPCAYVSCRWHLALDVSNDTGAIKVNFPSAIVDGALDVSRLPATCALVIADGEGLTLEQVGEILNLTRERVRQIETKGLERIAELARLAALQDDPDETHAAALVVHERLTQYELDRQRDAHREVEAQDESEDDEQPQREPMRGGPRPEWARGGVGFHFSSGRGMKFTPVAGSMLGEQIDAATDDVGFSVLPKDEVK